MRTKILIASGAALLVASLISFADAAERHHGKTDRAVVSHRQFDRNLDAYAAWPAPAAQPDWSYRYSGGYSAPAGH